jgi:glycosyltransferase involved in cell wall biosynthesis
MPTIAHVTSVHYVYDNRIFEKMCKSSLKVFDTVFLVATNTESQNVSGINIVSVNAQKQRVLRSLFGSLKVILTALKLKADVYHLHDPELLLWRFLLEKNDAVVIYDMHENVPKQILTKPWVPIYFKKPLSNLWKLMERLLIRKTPVIFAENSYRDDYKWVDSYETILNLPILANLLQIERSYDSDNSIAYVGRVAPKRGSVVTLKALGLLKKNGLELEFVCIGGISEQHKTELLELAKELDVNLSLKGFMKSIDALRFASKSKVGLSVLSKTGNYEHSYPTKIFEYMAIGLPVICSDIKLHSDIVLGSNCGLSVDPEDVNELAKVIKTIVEDIDLANEMSAKGKSAVVRNYDWAIEEKKLINFYKTQSKII